MELPKMVGKMDDLGRPPFMETSMYDIPYVLVVELY